MKHIKQFDIFDIMEKEQEQAKRLVKNDLGSLSYNVLKYLKENALGKKNQISGKELAKVFNFDNTSQVRYHINKIRNSKNVTVKIGSDLNGYYIPTTFEYLESVKFVIEKTLSMIETSINLMPEIKDTLHLAVGHFYKKADKAVEGQAQIQFTGYERDFIRRFAERYEEDFKEL